MTDFSKALDFILNHLKDFFKVEVANILTSAASQAFSQIMSGAFDKYLNSFVQPVLGTNNKVYVNLTLTNDKVFTFGKDQFSIPLDGTFLDANQSGAAAKLPSLPTNLPGAKAQPDLVLYISQHTL